MALGIGSRERVPSGLLALTRMLLTFQGR